MELLDAVGPMRVVTLARSAAALFVLGLDGHKYAERLMKYLTVRTIQQSHRTQLNDHLATIPFDRYPDNSRLHLYDVTDPKACWIHGLESVQYISSSHMSHC
jgi:hypothetical protein